MKKPRMKLIGGIILLIVLSCVYGGFLLVSNTIINTDRSMEASAAQIKSLDSVLDKDLQLYLTVSGSVLNRDMEKAILVSTAAESVMTDEEALRPEMYMGGALVIVNKDGIEYPKRFPGDVVLEPGQIKDDDGTAYVFDKETGIPVYIVCYSRVRGSCYYVAWNKYEDQDAKANEIFDFKGSIAGIEKAFNTDLMIIVTDTDSSGEHPVFYQSQDLPDAATAESLGITGEMLSEAIPASEKLSADLLSDASRMLTIDGREYEALFRQIQTETGFNGVIAFLTPIKDTRQLLREQSGIVLAVFLIIGITVLVLLISIIWLVRKYTLNERQREELSFASNWRRIIAILGVGAACIMVTAALTFALCSLYTVYQQVDIGLAAMEQRVTDNADQSKITEKENKKAYEDFAVLTADILTEYPAAATEENFREICDLIEADYIMLFDSQGREILSNSDFVNLKLGKDPSSSTYEFRRLLNGVRLITHDATPDEQTNMSDVMIGARYGSPKDGDGYGALLMAVPKGRVYGGKAETESDIMSSIVPDGMLAFSVDPESGVIREASDPALIGTAVSSHGLPEEALQEGFEDFFTFDGHSYYGGTKDIKGSLYYYAAPSEHIYNHILIYSLSAAIAAFLLLLLLTLQLMRGYRKGFEEYASVGELFEDPSDEIINTDGVRKRSMDPIRRWASIIPEKSSSIPYRNAGLALKVMFTICILIIGANIFSESAGSHSPLISFIVRGQWEKGFNLFAITNVFILLGAILVIVAVLKLIIRLAGRALGTKGETICRLMLNLLTYGGAIIFVYYSLYYLGFDPRTLLASLGLLSLAVSLGAKDLIADILAGLSIVFEGEFQVGDIIDVNGYRGEVLEIGVRTTKLKGRGGNIKIIGNQDVKNVINMTRMNSWYPLEVSISNDRSLQEIEELLAEQLPHIGASIPEIVSGPYYQGVISIGKGSMTISIIAECNEADYHRVQRALNRAVRELLIKHDIQIL